MLVVFAWAAVQELYGFREAAAAASIRTTWLVGLPDLEDRW